MIARAILASLPDNLPETDAQAAARRRRNIVIVILAIVVLIAAAAITTPSFLTVENLITVVRAASITGIVALGMSYITISGNLFALSAEELAILSACVFAWLMRAEYGLVASPGSHHYLLRAGRARSRAASSRGAPIPIITTLAFGAFFRGLASLVSQNQNIMFATDVARWIGTGRPLGVPTQSWAFIILTLLAWFVLQKTRFGRQLLLIGANRETATRHRASRRSGLAGSPDDIRRLLRPCGHLGRVAVRPGGRQSLLRAEHRRDRRRSWSEAYRSAAGRGRRSRRRSARSSSRSSRTTCCSTASAPGQRMLVVGCLVALATLGFHMIQRSRG